MTSIPAAKHGAARGHIAAAILCAVAGLILFHLFGNATRGYVKTTSIFWWWVSQWLDPRAESEHGWLILGLSAWLWWRNVAKPEIGNRKPESGDGKPESGRLGPEREVEGLKALTASSGPNATRPTEGDEVTGLSGSPCPVSGLRSPVSKTPQSIAPALAAMLAGLLLHAMGFAAQQTRVSIVAFLIFTWGVVRLAAGRRGGAAAMFPLGFMMFAIPVSILDEVGLPLRLWVTTAGECIAHVAGIDVIRSGTQLVAPDGRFNYDVAAPCSGVRSLLALTALSLLVGYLNFRSWWRRALIFALCFPLVYIGNVARIVAIVFAAQAGGSEMGDRAHEVMGYGVFVIVLGGLLLAVSALRRWMPESSGLVCHPLDDKPENADGGKMVAEPAAKGGRGDRESGLANVGGAAKVRLPAKSGRRAMVGAGAVLIIATLEMGFLYQLASAPARGQVGVVLATDGLNPIELPAFLGTEWIGQRAEVSAVEREILPADTGFSRKNYAFVADRNRDVFLSIVLSGRDRTSIHRPELCLTGQGWTVQSAVRQAFRDPSNADFPATVLRVRREVPSPRGKIVVPQLVAYWFVGGSDIVASHWQRFAHDAWHRITSARADRWAYVLMQTDARDGEAAALARMQAVLDGTLPVFQKAVRPRER